jgi:hypothetical protein
MTDVVASRVFDEEISACRLWVCGRFCPAGRGTLLDPIEDLANEVGIGDVFDHPELATAGRAPCAADVEDAFESLCL